MREFGDFESIEEGQSASLEKTITESDIQRFIEMTGDDNPLHSDPAFAEKTVFKEVVVHGMLGASFLSTLIGTKLPGPGALWLSQSMDFVLPVRLGDKLKVSCTVQRKHKRERLLELETTIRNQNGQTVLVGHGKVKVLEIRQEKAAEPARREPGVAIVSGGTGGIGRAVCLRLARDGYDIVVNYHTKTSAANDLVKTIEAGPTRALAIQADVSNPKDAARVVHETLRHFGTVDVLVNNASPRVVSKAVADLEWDDFQRHLDVQLKGAFLMSQSCLPYMLEQRHGRIINITSEVLDSFPTAGWTAYAVGKAGLATLSRFLAAEVGPSGVTVNCVAPGMTETGFIGDIPEKAQLIAARQTPARRLATPEDISAAVAFLTKGEASFFTGQTLRVNGGRTMPW